MSVTAGKKVLVYGGSGALGNALVNHFKQKQCWVVSVDLRANESANENILLNVSDSLVDQEKKLESDLKTMLAEGKLDAIMNVAGGWAGGNAASAQFLTNSQLMWSQSVCSSLLTASLAAKYLKEGGCLTLAGAAPAIDSAPTAGMMGYGLAKAAVHQLTKSLADAANSGLPKDSFVAAIAPITLDTPMNRKWMADSDFSSWTSLNYVAELFEKWINEANERPVNGSIVKLTTVKDKTTLTFH